MNNCKRVKELREENICNKKIKENGGTKKLDVCLIVKQTKLRI